MNELFNLQNKEFFTTTDVSEKLNVTNTSVWNAINSLGVKPIGEVLLPNRKTKSKQFKIQDFEKVCESIRNNHLKRNTQSKN